MITLFVALSLFITVKTSDLKDLQVHKVKRGENVTIKCDGFNGDKNKLFWFKQSFGKLPQLIVKPVEKTIRYGPGFNEGRFSTSVDKLFNLNIKEIKEEDSGTYFCAEELNSSLYFSSGTLLVVEAEEMKQPPPTVTVMENGESLTLQCSVQAFTSSCEGQSVYWFRHGSGESHPGIIYTHGDGSDECNKSSEAGSPTQSCVYTLPRRNLPTSDNGTFYCAVAACGQILFGNRIKVEVIQIQIKENNWIVYVLTTSNIISVIVIMVLVGVLLKKQRKGASNDHPNNTNQADDEDVLNYAAVSFAKKPSSSRTSRDKSHEDVYVRVKIK